MICSFPYIATASSYENTFSMSYPVQCYGVLIRILFMRRLVVQDEKVYDMFFLVHRYGFFIREHLFMFFPVHFYGVLIIILSPPACVDRYRMRRCYTCSFSLCIATASSYENTFSLSYPVHCYGVLIRILFMRRLVQDEKVYDMFFPVHRYGFFIREHIFMFFPLHFATAF